MTTPVDSLIPPSFPSLALGQPVLLDESVTMSVELLEKGRRQRGTNGRDLKMIK